MGAEHSLAILVSGTGRHLQHLAQLCAAQVLPARVACVLADRTGILALERARTQGHTPKVLDAERRLKSAEFSAQAFQYIEAAGCDTVVLAGFLRKLLIPPPWIGRVLNIHPSLLPAFGGKGFYGEHVHRAVLERGCQFSGCTVHYVDNEYDHGPILLQRVVPVLPDDDVHQLAERVFAAERDALPQALLKHWQRA